MVLAEMKSWRGGLGEIGDGWAIWEAVVSGKKISSSTSSQRDFKFCSREIVWFLFLLSVGWCGAEEERPLTVLFFYRTAKISPYSNGRVFNCSK